MPHGSVLGSLLFTLYNNEVEDIIEAHVLLPYNYADECKVFFYNSIVEHMSYDDNKLQHCIAKYTEDVPR